MVQSAQILSAAVGPFAGGILADVFGIRRTFLLTALLCAAAALLVARGYEAPPARGAPEHTKGSLRAVLGLAQVPSLLIILFFVNFVGRSFTPILPLHLRDLGVPPGRLASSTGILISVYSVAAALSATLLGKASRALPLRPLLAATLLAGAVTVLPMAWVPSLGLFLLLALLLGLASGGSLTLCYTMGGLMVPGVQRTTAFGFFSGAALFGGAVSPSLAGFLAGWNFRAIYPLDTALFTLMAVWLVGTFRPGAPGSEPPEPS